MRTKAAIGLASPATCAARLADVEWQRQTAAAAASSRAREALRMNQRNLKTLYEAGGKIGFGTDSGATPLRIPGIAEHRELALIVEAGLTPVQAITLATTRIAAVWHRGRVVR